MAEHIIYLLGPFQVPGLGQERHVRVYAPNEAVGGAPVLFMFDGQNIFHDAPSFSGGWYVHHAVKQLAEQGLPAPVIVGIDHGGSSRLDELSPFTSGDSAGRADDLLAWVKEDLAPRIAQEFKVRTDPAGTAVGGSSMGGLAALYAHFRHPDLFGAALCMSPSFWFAERKIFDYVAAQPKPWTSRIYIDAGAREDGGSVVADGERMVHHLRERGWDDTSLCWIADKDGTHSEHDWRKRAPAALQFLFTGTPGLRPEAPTSSLPSGGEAAPPPA